MPNEPISSVVEKVVEVSQSENFQKRPWILSTAALGLFVLVIAYIAITQKNSGEVAYKEISENESAENATLKKTNDLYNMELNNAYDSIRELKSEIVIFKLKDSIFKQQTRQPVKGAYKK